MFNILALKVRKSLNLGEMARNRQTFKETCKSKKKYANIFGTKQICAGKPDQGQVQMGSCWDANMHINVLTFKETCKSKKKYANIFVTKQICAGKPD